MKILIITHDDQDGWVSGKIAYDCLTKKCKNIDLVYVDYGRLQDLESTNISQYNKVYMFDFHIQPDKKMIKFAKKCKSLVWIDHHESAKTLIKPLGRLNNVIINFKIGKGACYLVWKYFYANKSLPKYVDLISRYDVFDLDKNLDNVAFAEFMKFFSYKFKDQTNNIWNLVRDSNIQKTINVGHIIFESKLYNQVEVLKQRSYEINFQNYKTLVVNSDIIQSSLPFESFDKNNQYDIYLVYRYLGNNLWTSSLYSKNINVGDIATKLGGGGHEHASGFQIDTQNMIKLGIF